MTIEEYLLKLMRERHITQAEIARATGFSKSTISLMAAGKREPTVRFLDALSNAYFIPRKELFETLEMVTGYEPGAVNDSIKQGDTEIDQLKNLVCDKIRFMDEITKQDLLFIYHFLSLSSWDRNTTLNVLNLLSSQQSPLGS